MTRKSIVRRDSVLKIIVDDYIATAIPVASESVIRKYHIGVSSATIRNDMARLEEEGYITRPHTSSGSVPRDKGYRQYVESLTDTIELPKTERVRIRQFFGDASDEIDSWLKLAAGIIAHNVSNAALVTFPKAAESQLMHIELLPLRDFMALLILVMNEAIVKRKFLSFGEDITHERLVQIANKLNMVFSGLTKSEIAETKVALTPDEKMTTQAIMDMMTAQNEENVEGTYLEGLRLLLGQPEFVQKDKMLLLMELMEDKSRLGHKISTRAEEGIQVRIGEECHDDALKDLSLVFGTYGIPHKLYGTIGVIGPTRMDYQRVIATVTYVSELLGDLLSGEFHND